MAELGIHCFAQGVLVVWTSHFGGLSRWRAQGLGAQHMSSVVGAFRLQSAGSVVVAEGLSCFVACEIFPDKGSNLCRLHWHVDSYPQCHQGSSSNLLFFLSFFLNPDTRGIRYVENKRTGETDGWCLPGDQKEKVTQQFKVKFNSENQNILISFRIINFCLKTWWCAKDRWIQFCESFKTFLFHKSWLKHTGNGSDAYSPTLCTYLEWRKKFCLEQL